MTVYSPGFNVNNYELRGEVNNYLTQDQFGASLDLQYRLPAQLDWLGQLLGWSGTNYWSAFSASPDQKRQLLSGSYGVYNGFVYPEIVEVRNWDNIVVVKNNQYIKEGQTFILGDFDYVLKGVTPNGDNLELDFGELTEQFLSDLSTTQQLKVVATESIPAPFRRSDVGASADASFTCDVSDGNITLYSSFDKEKTLPYIFNTFYAGSRYYFDLPVVLIITDDYFIAPTYNFDKELWQIDIPCELTKDNTGLSARLDYECSFLIVSIKQWEDPSDWLDSEKIKYYLGAWGNKGGYLPFHHVFDSLSLHGFDEKKSIYLDAIEREIEFDRLLNFAYLQKAEVNETPPPNADVQAWWDSVNREFMLYINDPINCGPWVQSSYPKGLHEEITPDITFVDMSSFRSYPEEFDGGVIVEIMDGSGLGFSDSVIGVVQTLYDFFSVKLVKLNGQAGWAPLEFRYDNEGSFNGDCLALPPDTTVVIENANGLSEKGINYEVANLKFTISGDYSVTVMRGSSSNQWYLQPPSHLKYIGNTRLYESSFNYDFPVNGEMHWDFSNPSVYNRSSSIFFYTGWDYNPLTESWEMVGNWFDVNTGLKGIVTSLTNLIGGSGYADGVYDDVSLEGGSGSGVKAMVTVTSGSVTSVSVMNGGSDYVDGDSLNLQSGDLGGGLGFSIQVEEVNPKEPPKLIDYSAIIFYCNGNLLTEEEIFLSDNFQIFYTIDSITGKIIFNYSPRNYEGSIKFPKITVSDSLTSSFTHDISSLIFNGLTYHVSPNVADSETLLRIWKSTPLYCIDNVKESNLLSYPNALIADSNNGPADFNWERYFIRLPPSYQRDGSEWQKVNLTCQDFGLWGSPVLPEDMVCPTENEKPDIYEEIIAQLPNGRKPSNYVYSEPYLYSTCIPRYEYSEDYNNSTLIPVPDGVRDGYEEGKIVRYEPLHERRVDTKSLMGKGYGDWEGSYFRISDCSYLNGHFVNDLNSGSLEEIPPPIWDASIYKVPNTCLINEDSSKVDANHFKVGYAFFVADLSAAEEAVFDFI